MQVQFFFVMNKHIENGPLFGEDVLVFKGTAFRDRRLF